MKKTSLKIVISVLVMIGIISITILLISKKRKGKSEIYFFSESITLYQNDPNSNSLVLRELIEFKDSEVVDEMCEICNRSTFTNYNYSLNKGMDYFLVFNDSGLVIAFSSFDSDYGTIGENFKIEYTDKVYENPTILYDDLKPLVHIPINLLDLVKNNLNY